MNYLDRGGVEYESQHRQLQVEGIVGILCEEDGEDDVESRCDEEGDD
jgi:hypothetical protein